MDEKNKKQLDKLQQEELIDNILSYLIISLIIFFLCLLFFGFKYCKGPSIEMSGTMVDVQGKAEKTNEFIYIYIKLDDGSIIVTLKPALIDYKKNQKVTVMKSKSFFGGIHYNIKSIEGK